MRHPIWAPLFVIGLCSVTIIGLMLILAYPLKALVMALVAGYCGLWYLLRSTDSRVWLVTQERWTQRDGETLSVEEQHRRSHTTHFIVRE